MPTMFSDRVIDDEVRTATHALVERVRAEAGPLFVLTGAGVSLASGVPTFRGTDPEAVWAHDVTELGTLAYFERDPVGSWRWYRRRFRTLDGKHPNAAHLALAALERWQLGRGRDFCLVSQNIDTLHEQAGSRSLIKVHGSADRVRCSRDGCRFGAPEGTLPRSRFNLEQFDEDPSLATVPRCPACWSPMRQHVLWFDEHYGSHADYQFDRVLDFLGRAGIIVCVGTSFAVGVTDIVVTTAERRRVPVFVVDPRAPPLDPDARRIHIAAPAEMVLPFVCELLGASGREGTPPVRAGT